MGKFFGRNTELKKLRELTRKSTSSLVVIKGRRRIGKSRLAEEFGKIVGNVVTLTGMPPSQNLSAQQEKDDFAQQMSRALKIPPFKTEDWGDLFFYLANETATKPYLVILDEINWMGSKDPTFLGKLKTAWDTHFSKNPKLIMILCGSLSGWIERNILTSTGFVGRISKTFSLRELPLATCNLFWKKKKNLISPYEKFKILAITGGIPKYLEEVVPEKTAEQNIFDLCFQNDGFLFNEFKHLFHDLFSKKSEKYRSILLALAMGPKTLDEIYSALHLKKTGYVVAEYMNDLEEAGFVQRDYTWNLARAKKSKLSVYRLSDNYARFYLKHIEPFADQIKLGTVTKIPSYDGVMGLQFENLVLNNRKHVHTLLGIDPSTIVIDNPYFQNSTTKHHGCQIDYMIQTEHGILYCCEIKFSKHKVKPSVITEVKEKIKHLPLRQELSVRPVLIHVNGVSAKVEQSGYFTKIIDFSDLLSCTLPP